ncbi:MAG: WecB/TagA/CpsF family glycosyltransferase [Cyanobacteriota bacterium]
MAATVTVPRRTQVLGLPVDVAPDLLAEAIALHGRGGGQIVTINAEMTMAGLEDPALGAAISAAELVIPDGAGVVWALARQGIRVTRCPGIELARALLAHGAAQGWAVALVGASPAVMEELRRRLPQELPGLRLVLAEHGYQSAEAWPALEQRLRQLRPDLVRVALGVPRQETWIHGQPRPLGGLWMGVGGSFDVWSGAKKRAPGWMGTLNVEWLYRLVQEPTRWRRMLALPAFARAVIRRG